jgi:hypothetical protein
MLQADHMVITQCCDGFQAEMARSLGSHGRSGRERTTQSGGQEGNNLSPMAIKIG